MTLISDTKSLGGMTWCECPYCKKPIYLYIKTDKALWEKKKIKGKIKDESYY